MSKISKKKFWEAVKKEPDKEHAIFEIFKQPITKEEWLRGHKQWKKQKQNADNKRTNRKELHERMEPRPTIKPCQ